MCSISWKRCRNTWMTGIVPFWKIFCHGQKNFRQESAKLKYWWLQSSRLKMSRYSLFCVYFISGTPSEMDIKSAIGFFQCLWRVNNFLLCGYLVYDCLPEQASMPTDFSILLKFYDTLFSLENTKLYNKLNRLR